MDTERISIPLNQPNPARQRFWRAVWLVCLAALGAVCGVLIYRAYTFRSHPLLWPATAVSALRLAKTAENISDAELLLQGSLANPNLQLSPDRELRVSRSGIVLFFDQNGETVGLATDRQISTTEQGSLTLLGLTTSKDAGRMSTISQQTQVVTRHSLLAPWLLNPKFDGLWLNLNNNKINSSPVTFSSNQLTLRANFSSLASDPNLALDEQTHLLASFTASPELAQALTPSVPAVFPGTKALTNTMRSVGFSALIGVDSSGLAFALGLNDDSFAPEELGQITKELTQIQNLSTQNWTSDGITFNELRGDSVNIDFAHDLGLDRVIATGKNGDLTRATQVEGSLIVSNRAINLSSKGSRLSTPCLPHSLGFIAPSELLSLLSPVVIYKAHDFTALLQSSERISWSKTQLRFCLNGVDK